MPSGVDPTTINLSFDGISNAGIKEARKAAYSLLIQAIDGGYTNWIDFLFRLNDTCDHSDKFIGIAKPSAVHHLTNKSLDLPALVPSLELIAHHLGLDEIVKSQRTQLFLQYLKNLNGVLIARLPCFGTDEALGELNPIHTMVQRGELALLKEAFRYASLNVDAQTESLEGSNFTYLHLAARRNDLAMVQYLLSIDADPTILSLKGETASALATDPQVRSVLEEHSKKIRRQKGFHFKTEILPARTKAIKRLMRDLIEAKDEPIPGIIINVNEQDLFEWHILLTSPMDSPFKGITFHLTVIFPVDYPQSPPKIQPNHYIPHPNVFGSYICLDMIKDASLGSSYSGWTIAYTASSILRQLQNFLMSENVPQYGYSSPGKVLYVKNYKADDDDQIERAKEEASLYVCQMCGYFHPENDPLKHPDQKRVSHKNIHAKYDAQLPSVYKGRPLLLEVSRDMLLSILEYLGPQDLLRFQRTCKTLEKFCQEHGVWIRTQVKCYVNKTSFTEDVLGVGLKVEYRHESCEMKQLRSPLDF
eukprot:TRINITY_DN5445_c0_g1_i3.p1 TRINITY_DN5445_c0_g1~~TRINITY_DN5445_c0_g1_i3.p1  ORF type:complete len:532 (-),score=116.03 TRINITY_DN5445_c0_g1_i3:64-1659(-)